MAESDEQPCLQLINEPRFFGGASDSVLKAEWERRQANEILQRTISGLQAVRRDLGDFPTIVSVSRSDWDKLRQHPDVDAYGKDPDNAVIFGCRVVVDPE